MYSPFGIQLVMFSSIHRFLKVLCNNHNASEFGPRQLSTCAAARVKKFSRQQFLHTEYLTTLMITTFMYLLTSRKVMSQHYILILLHNFDMLHKSSLKHYDCSKFLLSRNPRTSVANLLLHAIFTWKLNNSTGS